MTSISLSVTLLWHASVQQVTEDANRKATSAKEQAAQAAQDALDKGQAHGETAWQKAKDAASHVYETVRCQGIHLFTPFVASAEQCLAWSLTMSFLCMLSHLLSLALHCLQQ